MDDPDVKGKKLIIEIPVKAERQLRSADESLSGKTIPSNNTDSAISSIIKTTEPAQSWNFEIPKVKLPVVKTDISGTKTWVDDSNADNTRPDSITLKLYRNIKGGDKTDVTGVTPTLDKERQHLDIRIQGSAEDRCRRQCIYIHRERGTGSDFTI